MYFSKLRRLFVEDRFEVEFNPPHRQLCMYAVFAGGSLKLTGNEALLKLPHDNRTKHTHPCH